MYKRNTFIYVILVLVSLILGVLTTKLTTPFTKIPIIANYATQGLWAAVIYWTFCLIMVNHRAGRVVLFALLFCYLMEVSQLYHAPWIDTMRTSELGGFFLGNKFSWDDIICGTVSIYICFSFEKILYSSKI